MTSPLNPHGVRTFSHLSPLQQSSLFHKGKEADFKKYWCDMKCYEDDIPQSVEQDKKDVCSAPVVLNQRCNISVKRRKIQVKQSIISHRLSYWIIFFSDDICLTPPRSVFLGVFITKGDVGVGTIVGSAVFNVLVIIGLCGIFAGQVCTLCSDLKLKRGLTDHFHNDKRTRDKIRLG